MKPFDSMCALDQEGGQLGIMVLAGLWFNHPSVSHQAAAGGHAQATYLGRGNAPKPLEGGRRKEALATPECDSAPRPLP